MPQPAMPRVAETELARPNVAPAPEGRLEDLRLLLGRGRYIDDVPIPAGTLHAAIVRSPHAHARLGTIDTTAARAVPGVVAVYAAREVTRFVRPFPVIVRTAPEYLPLAVEKVRYVGEPVAVVLASSRYAAEDGAERVVIDYDPMPTVVDPVAAAEPGAPVLHEKLGTNIAWQRRYTYGRPAEAFADADVVVRATLRFPKYNSTPLETYGVIAEFAPDSGVYTVHANFQGPFSLVPVMARALDVQEDRLRIIVPEDVGGSFGNKSMVYPYMVLMAACARLAGRPVKWIEDRAEHLVGSASGTDRLSIAEAAVRRDGIVLAMRVKMYENVGAYLRAPEPSCVMRSLTTFSGPYRIEHGEIDVATVMTSKLPTGLNRGYGGQQHAFTVERLMDRVAEATNLDPAEVRRRNLIRPDELPRRMTTGSYYDSGDYVGCLEKALALSKYDALKAERDRLRGSGRMVGIGLATIIHSAASNIGYVTLALPPEDRAQPGYRAKSGTSDIAHASLDPSGRIRVRIATAGAGQGHVTTAAQIVAGQFGLPAEEIAVQDHMDTGSSLWSVTSGTYASRFSVVTAGAVHRAAAALRERILEAAAEMLGVAAEALEIVGGRVRLRASPERSLSLRQVAGAVYWDRGSFRADANIELQAAETYAARNLQPPDARDRVNAAATYGFMADVALLEIDPETWMTKVLKYIAVHDVGRPLNPTLIRGQIAGGIMHGIGGALYEELVYGDDGQMLNGSFMEYLCPTAAEAPEMIIDHHDVPAPFNELGTKGCGENSAMSAPAAVAGAIEDALRPLKVHIDELPATPSALWRLVAEKAAKPSG